MSTRPLHLGTSPHLARLIAIGLLCGGVAAAGCGDETRCPAGFAGRPCRFVEDSGNAPDALPLDADPDTREPLDGVDAADQENDGLTSDGSGDAGPDVDAGDGRQDDAEVGAHIETPNAHAVARLALASGVGFNRRQPLFTLAWSSPTASAACASEVGFTV